MIANYIPHNTDNFNEDQWLNTLFLIQTWLDEIHAKLMYQLPVKNKKKLLRKAHFLTAPALAHILERHYHKIHRYPQAGKFTIPIADILSLMRDTVNQPAVPASGTHNLLRTTDTGRHIGFDHHGKPTAIISVLSDAGGKIITAFPGVLSE
jgi:hypothetical protein